MMAQETQPKDEPSQPTSPAPTPRQEQETQPPSQASQGSAPSSPPAPTEESPMPPPDVAVNTKIPPGLENPAAGSKTVGRWLAKTFRTNLATCRALYPKAKTLRQIVSCLETSRGMTPPTATEAEATGQATDTDPKETGSDVVSGADSEGEVAEHTHDAGDPIHFPTHDGRPPHQHTDPGVDAVAEGGSERDDEARPGYPAGQQGGAP